MEVRGGDYPRRGEGTVGALVYWAASQTFHELKSSNNRRQGQQNVGEITDESEDHFTELMDSDRELESLF